jgi:hypothetical protein
MSDSNDRDIDWSPWTHPKAKRWFTDLLEQTHLPIMMEHAIDGPDDLLDEGLTRLIVALGLLLGREGIWPEQRDLLLRTIVRKGDLVSRRSNKSEGPISLAQHKSHGLKREQLIQEVEMLRRRIGMSNRRNQLDPPSWGGFWS